MNIFNVVGDSWDLPLPCGDGECPMSIVVGDSSTLMRRKERHANCQSESALRSLSAWQMAAGRRSKGFAQARAAITRQPFEGLCPVITKIFMERYRKGASSVIFSLDDVRNACDALAVRCDLQNALANDPTERNSRIESTYSFCDRPRQYAFERRPAQRSLNHHLQVRITTVKPLEVQRFASYITRLENEIGRKSSPVDDHLPASLPCSKERARCGTSGA